MVEDGSLQDYLALSRSYLDAAETLARVGHEAPAYHNALHALELAVKAALTTRLAQVPQTHNVGGLFGREFRARLGGDVCSRISTLLHRYDGPRYPDWELPDGWRDDVAFVSTFIRSQLPALVEEAGG